MICFVDGPAANVELRLMRAPVLLRVVTSPSGKWDALDQLDDIPRPREKIYVYWRIQEPTRYSIRCTPRSASGVYLRADYHLFPIQPDDAQMRTAEAWRAWCDEMQRRSTAAHEGVLFETCR